MKRRSKEIEMIKPNRILSFVFLPFLLAMSFWATAGDVQRVGGAYLIHLPATVNFKQVVDRLEHEVLAHNWEVLKIQDIDKGLKQNYGMDIQNKVVYACKSQYLAQAIKEDPNITLIVPCRFAVYRVGPTGEAVGGKMDECRGGKVVVGVADPVQEAKALGIQQRDAAALAGKELQDILQAVADAFKGK
jgi:uncharacterized protein (DUF302 family)